MEINKKKSLEAQKHKAEKVILPNEGRKAREVREHVELKVHEAQGTRGTRARKAQETQGTKFADSPETQESKKK